MYHVFLAIVSPASDGGGGSLLLDIILMIVMPAIFLIGLLCLVAKLSGRSNKDSESAEQEQTYAEWLDAEDE